MSQRDKWGWTGCAGFGMVVNMDSSGFWIKQIKLLDKPGLKNIYKVYYSKQVFIFDLSWTVAAVEKAAQRIPDWTSSSVWRGFFDVMSNTNKHQLTLKFKWHNSAALRDNTQKSGSSKDFFFHWLIMSRSWYFNTSSYVTVSADKHIQ